jgi:NAD(P)-dependent dehydrogenase (short-subunit alcohol dehydrogenase family)
MFTLRDIPPQDGRFTVVTGATGGLGYETALALAGAGGKILLAARNDAKGAAALAAIRAVHPNADIAYGHIDLADLASVKAFADKVAAENDRIDVLVNNAGVMMPPARHVTKDGFELQFGANYLGHFALTARLLPLLRKGAAPRVVNVSSGAHRMQAAIHFDDLQWQKSYSPWRAYAQSKLAMILFAFELERRSQAGGWGIMSNSAHPGYARTDLQSSGPGLGRTRPSLMEGAMALLAPFMSQTAAAGALPQIFAAVSPRASGAGYYGPQGLGDLTGPVGAAKIGKAARDPATGPRLWAVSEALTGVRWG